MSDAPSLFARLKAAAAPEWAAYVDHAFVRRLIDGSLSEDCFRHYLGQDYLFLIEFARAYGLAVYKSRAVEDVRQAAAGLAGILEETTLHVAYCRERGIPPEDMAALRPARATLAYTAYVMDRGMAGDLLDLEVALAPCIIGYAEIAARPDAKAAGAMPGHLYASWITAYGGDDYQVLARRQEEHLDRLMRTRGGEGRFPALVEVFRDATRLEADFWQMGLALSW